ncbi:TPA: hypothetical protein NGR52_004229 [Vibrio parahaemolyticus]|nr:hypothetical protein [Vibrio parahaemolyticus]
MHSVITESDPKFNDIKNKVEEVKPRLQFAKIAKDVKDLIINHRGKGHVVIEYAHDQISNVVYALKRYGLNKNEDYYLTRNISKTEGDNPKKVQEIIITPIVGNNFKKTYE